MTRFPAQVLLFLLPACFASDVWAQSRSPRVADASAREKTPSRVAPIAKRELFGALPVSTRSDEALRFVEFSLDNYENHIQAGALSCAHQAVAKDGQFALGYAALSLASLGGIPDPTALARAKALAPRATPDEQLLIRWMTSIGDRDLLPAISASNDLVKRYPNNPRILYLVADWLYYQQDFDRARKMLETINQIDPNFAPALNLLSYAYIQTGSPDPARALASAKRYAEVLPDIQNPQDTWGEISRITGDDQGALEHYAASLAIDPNYVSSHWGLGDTATLMGNYERARKEYDGAIAVADNPRDRNHAQFQKALVYFWEGRAEQGRKMLAELQHKAAEEKEPYSQFEIGLGRAMLAESPAAEIEQLRTLESWLRSSMEGFADSDRMNSLAQVLRERARIAAASGATAEAEGAIAKLEQLASQSTDPLISNCYETAKGYLLAVNGDLTKAAEELDADPRSILAVSEEIAAEQKQGNTAAAEALRARVKYLRAPSVEWYLYTHATAAKQAS